MFGVLSGCCSSVLGLGAGGVVVVLRVFLFWAGQARRGLGAEGLVEGMKVMRGLCVYLVQADEAGVVVVHLVPELAQVACVPEPQPRCGVLRISRVECSYAAYCSNHAIWSEGV